MEKGFRVPFDGGKRDSEFERGRKEGEKKSAER